MQTDRFFRLSEAPGAGIHCSKLGFFFEQTPLLERARALGGRMEWRVRSFTDIERDLGAVYCVEADLVAKAPRLDFVAHALNSQNEAHAQISALLLQFPDPSSTRSVANPVEFVALGKSSEYLTRDWDSDNHPRWPAGSPAGAGGKFSPKGEANNVPTPDSRRHGSGSSTGQDVSSRQRAATIGVLTHQIHQPGGWTACIYSNDVLLMFQGHVKCPDAAFGDGG